MDDLLAKQMIKQLKAIRFWLTFFGMLFLVFFAILGFLIFKVVTAINDTKDSISSFRQQTSETLNIKDYICSNTPFSATSDCKSDGR